MNLKTFIPATALVVALLGLDQFPALAQSDGILFKARLSGTNYCHLKFPAYREETLSWSRPVLSSPGEGDIVDYYGSCDYDPTGKLAVKEARRRDRHERKHEAVE